VNAATLARASSLARSGCIATRTPRGATPAAGLCRPVGSGRRSCAQDSHPAASGGGMIGRGLGDVLRTFGVEVLVCPKCGGVRRALAASRRSPST
jgi:hypothetical protein